MTPAILRRPNLPKLDQFLCIYCGIKRADTRDHIPPALLFEPRSEDLITVPACRSCNQGFSDSDQRFRLMLSLSVGLDQPDIRALWSKKTLRGAHRNPGSWQEFRSSIVTADISTEMGIYIGKRGVGAWDTEDEKAIISRHIKGLYFYEYGTPLLQNVIVNVQRIKTLTQEMVTQMESMPIRARAIAGGRFQYAFARVLFPEHQKSIWLLQYFNRYVVLVTTDVEGYVVDRQ